VETTKILIFAYDNISDIFAIMPIIPKSKIPVIFNAFHPVSTAIGFSGTKQDSYTNENS